MEELLQAHSRELTVEAARRAPVEARPDSCRRGHPRTDPTHRCPTCEADNKRRALLRRRERERQARLAG